ncbi:MAG: hypothetical protein EPO11_05770 [Gammaproteobacteria bacterium]|nr:MAG: hypothetical protein EPO11_05770 [Gammaproteobacteria bacterium]
MTHPSNLLPNKIYYLNPTLSFEQLSNAVSSCLCKAEALATMATLIDIEVLATSDSINNYFWALSEIIQEAQWLYEKITNNN